MTAPNNIYPAANTIICIEESKLLKQLEYDILYNTKSLKTALDELNNVNYFHTYKNAQIDNYGSMLDGLMVNTFALMKEISPLDFIWRIFALYYDVHNMKLIVKEKFTGTKFDHLGFEYGSYSLPTIRSAAVRETDNILENEILTLGLFEALHSKDIHETDFILDKTYFKALKKFACEISVLEIFEFVTAKIDLFNISAYFQSLATDRPNEYFARAFSGEGSYELPEWEFYITGDIKKMEKFPLYQKYISVWDSNSFDVLSDNYLINKTKICKIMAFGIEPICAYFFNKFMEIKNIRILLAGKERNYAINFIKQRMRIPYEL
jgi:V/A-type H+-transporting ATPase subunit C